MSFFTAHTVSFDHYSIFLNLYFSHSNLNQEFLQRVSTAQSGLFIDKD